MECNAPGYSPDIRGIFEDFSGGAIPAGWSVENNSGDGGLPWIVFEGGDPCGQFPGNMTGGTGPYAIVNSNCDGFVTDDTNLITPSVDMSAMTSPLLRFRTDYLDCCGSSITADYTVDGGANWTNVYAKAGSSDRGPKSINAFLDAAGEPNVQARFHFNGFWAWWWQVDNVLLGEAGCLPGTGGLVVGNVYDASTGNGLNGATVDKPRWRLDEDLPDTGSRPERRLLHPLRGGRRQRLRGVARPVRLRTGQHAGRSGRLAAPRLLAPVR